MCWRQTGNKADAYDGNADKKADNDDGDHGPILLAASYNCLPQKSKSKALFNVVQFGRDKLRHSGQMILSVWASVRLSIDDIYACIKAYKIVVKQPTSPILKIDSQINISEDDRI